MHMLLSNLMTSCCQLELGRTWGGVGHGGGVGDGQRRSSGNHPPSQGSSSYLGCLMGTSSTSSGGIWKSSGSLPLAWSRSGRTSNRPLGAFQPCCIQIYKQSTPVTSLPLPLQTQQAQGLGQAEVLTQALWVLSVLRGALKINNNSFLYKLCLTSL